MVKQLPLLGLAVVGCLLVACGDTEVPTDVSPTATALTDPGCTDGDCPPDPGCTDGGCDPNYRDSCCCVEDASQYRTCCCNSDEVVTCRLSVPIGDGLHATIDDVRLVLNKGKPVCGPDWFPMHVKGFHARKAGCTWWKKIHRCHGKKAA